MRLIIPLSQMQERPKITRWPSILSIMAAFVLVSNLLIARHIERLYVVSIDPYEFLFQAVYSIACAGGVILAFINISLIRRIYRKKLIFWITMALLLTTLLVTAMTIFYGVAVYIG
jgi:hypothetical protein